LCQDAPVSAWKGWAIEGSAHVVRGADPGDVCIIQYGSAQWAGLYLPQVLWSDYSVSIRVRLESGNTIGWGLAVGATWSSGEASGFALQYAALKATVPQNVEYEQVKYPSTTPFSSSPAPSSADWDWRTLKVTVQGSRCTFTVDGMEVGAGSLPGTGDGVFIRIWNQGAVELQPPTIAPA
jgi:hypothetical protein